METKGKVKGLTSRDAGGMWASQNMIIITLLARAAGIV
jgi:hypothetical protein